MENFSPTYIRKCKACPELQALWTPKNGDYYTNVNNSIFQITTDEGLPAHESSISWVPSLYQMYDICKTMPRMVDNNVNDLNLLSKMRVTISSSCCNNYLNSQSMHDFWLLFWMHLHHSKDWNEGANKWT